MQTQNKDIKSLIQEYAFAKPRRQNEIFEQLSCYAQDACQNVYNILKEKYGEICKYEDCLMTAYENLHKILLTATTGTKLYNQVYRSCYKDLEKQYMNLLEEQEFLRNAKLNVAAITDEENWDDINEGKRIWKKLSKYDNNHTRKTIMKLYFGLDGENPHSQAEIAKMLGVSQESVRRAVSRYGVKQAGRVANLNLCREKALDLAETNKYTQAEIACLCKLSESQVRKILNGQQRILKQVSENNEF